MKCSFCNHEAEDHHGGCTEPLCCCLKFDWNGKLKNNFPIRFDNQETNEMVEDAWHDTLAFLDYSEEEIEILKDNDELVDEFFKALLKVSGERMVEQGIYTREELQKLQLREYLDGWYKACVEATAERLLEERGYKK